MCQTNGGLDRTSIPCGNKVRVEIIKLLPRMLKNHPLFVRKSISLLMNMRLQRRCISRRLLVVSLTTVKLTCGNSNSFWTGFYSHNTIYLKEY